MEPNPWTNETKEELPGKLTDALMCMETFRFSHSCFGSIQRLDGPDMICAARRRTKEQSNRNVCQHVATQSQARPDHGRGN